MLLEIKKSYLKNKQFLGLLHTYRHTVKNIFGTWIYNFQYSSTFIARSSQLCYVSSSSKNFISYVTFSMPSILILLVETAKLSSSGVMLSINWETNTCYFPTEIAPKNKINATTCQTANCQLSRQIQ